MACRIIEVSLRNDSQGDATEYSGYFSGWIDRVVIESAVTETFATLTVTDDDTGETVLAKTGGVTDASYAPRGAGEAAAGAAVTGVYSPIRVTLSRLKCVLDVAGAIERLVKLWVYVTDEQPVH